MKLKAILGLIVVAVGCAYAAFDALPRVITDYRHARDFGPSATLVAKNYRCTNYAVILFNTCTVSYLKRDGEEARFTEWRLGRAPSGSIRLVQSYRDPSVVSTTAGVDTIVNRVAFAFIMMAGSMFMLASLLVLLRRELVGEDETSAARA